MWDFSRKIYESGGIVSAICHGPAALLGIKLSNGILLIKGKKLTGFTNKEEAVVKLEKIMPFALETELIKSGAKFVGKDNWENNVVIDGNLVTGQNPASAYGVGAAIAERISSK